MATSRPPEPLVPEPETPERDTVLPKAPLSEAQPTTAASARSEAPVDKSDEESDEKVDHTLLGDLDRLATDRLTVTMPSTLIDPHAPPVALPMLDFRERLIRGALPPEVKDRAWRHLGELARTEDGPWNLFALGCGYPLLRKESNKLTLAMTYRQKRQVHFTLAIEFLFALHRLDLSTPRVFNRLVDAACTHTSGRKRRPKAWTYDLDAFNPDLQPTSAHGNPETNAEINDEVTADQVLERVIARINAAPGRQRITDRQATLIRRTYLDGQRLRDVAAELGLSEPSASKQRTRAAAVIARALGRPDLVDLRPGAPPAAMGKGHPEEPSDDAAG